jgi:antitoxin component YwqK of YwqJK toxin-antitoxin module
VHSHHPDGSLRERARMRGGVLDGVTRTYENGMETARIRYRMGRLHGPMRLFDDVGQLSWKSAYRVGMLNGETVAFRDGREMELATFVDGLQEGAAATFHPDGTPASHLPYRAGRLDGRAAWFAPDGALLRTADYAAGVLEGELVEYRPRGAVRSRARYREGALQDLVEYGDDGEARLKTWFAAGAPSLTLECRADPPPACPATIPVLKIAPALAGAQTTTETREP